MHRIWVKDWGVRGLHPECSCGWRGAVHRSWETALDQAREHKDQEDRR